LNQQRQTKTDLSLKNFLMTLPHFYSFSRVGSIQWLFSMINFSEGKACWHPAPAKRQEQEESNVMESSLMVQWSKPYNELRHDKVETNT